MTDEPIMSEEQARANLALSHEIIRLFMRDNVEPDHATDALCLAVLQTWASRYMGHGITFEFFMKQFCAHCFECKDEFDKAAAAGELRFVEENEGQLN